MPRPGDKNSDKLYKVQQFFKHLKANFKVNYNPHHEQAVDKAMIKYKGQTSLKQYRVPSLTIQMKSSCFAYI